MRFSSYNILSNYIPNQGYAVLNGLSGAIDLIDEDLFDAMTDYGTDEIDSTELPLSDDDLEDFFARGYITNMSIDDEVELARTIAGKMDKDRNDYLIVLAVNLNCNYRCVYCFEKETTCFKQHKNQLLTKAQVDGVFKALEGKELKASIQLFGGEPLSKDTVEIVDYIIHKAEKLDCTFKATTNAHELQYFFQYLGKDMINTLQITIDGPREVHDKRRIALDGTSSFDAIIDNVEYVVKNKKDVHIDLRINVDDTNIDHVEELIDFLYERGILESDQVSIYISKVCGSDINIEDENILNHKIYVISKKYPVLSPDIDIQKVKFDLNLALMLGIPIQRYCTYCTMLTLKQFVFSPDGCVYSCSELIGKKNHAMATYDEKGNIYWNENICKNYEEHKLVKNDHCIKCRYALLCTGGCFKLATNEKSDYSSRHCTIYNENYPRLLAEMVSEKLAALS